MVAFPLSPAQVAFLASCLHVGFEGPPDPENSADDVAAVAALLEELDAIAGEGGSAEITVARGDEDELIAPLVSAEETARRMDDVLRLNERE